MQLNEIKKRDSERSARQVGRGGKRGKTSGKGHKGQKARAGRKLRPEMRDIIKKIPKRRGYGKNRARTVNSGKEVPQTISLDTIEKNFGKGEEVSPRILHEKGLVKIYMGHSPKVKILSSGEISIAVTIVGCSLSASAKEKIEKAGGKVK